jgi:Fe2+ or Zn2+ uptake regulation protein
LHFEQISEAQLAEEILRYFLEHPNAADSLEGIAKWRLSWAVSGGLARTARALQQLVEMGFLEEIQIMGSSPVFQLNQANHASATSFLEARKKIKHDDVARG